MLTHYITETIAPGTPCSRPAGTRLLNVSAGVYCNPRDAHARAALYNAHVSIPGIRYDVIELDDTQPAPMPLERE